MNSSSEIVLSTNAAANLEKAYLNDTLLGEQSLIEIAGLSCAHHLLKSFGPFNEDHIVICVGPDKNGAVGLSTAFHLAKYADKITICMPLLTIDPVNIQNKKRLIHYYPSIEFTHSLVNGDIYIDALFGGEEMPKMEASVKTMIEELNRQSNPLVAIDIPTGINANSGQFSLAVKTDVTLALGVLRPVHQREFKKVCGHVALIDLGFPDSLINEFAKSEAIKTEKAS